MSSTPWTTAAATLNTHLDPPRRLVPGVTAPHPTRRAPVWAAPLAPAPGMGAPNPLWWWLGAHGGSGVSTLTALVANSADARRGWPSGSPQQSPNVVLVARTHLEGLERTRDLLRQHSAGGLLPPALRVLGLVTIADAPGKPPAAVRRLMKLLTAAVPDAWHLPWVEAWRGTPLRELPVWLPTTTAGPRRRGGPPVAVLPAAYLSCAVALTAAAHTHPAGPSTRAMTTGPPTPRSTTQGA